MKILIYAHIFPPSKGGVQFSNLEIIKGLHARGHQIRVIACHNKGIRQYVKELPFKVKTLPKWNFATMSSLSGNGLWNWFFLPWYATTHKNTIKSFQPDSILVTDETANTFWGIWAHKVTVPYISYCSVPHLEKWIKKSTENSISPIRRIQYKFFSQCLIKSYANAESIIAVSNSTKNKLSEAMPQFKDRISIIPRSVDNRFFKAPVDLIKIQEYKNRFHINDNSFILLSVARLAPKKGIDDTLKAVAGLPSQLRNQIKYIIVGGGESKPQLEALSEILGLYQNTVFTGAIPHKDLIPLYDMCDLFILPSRRGASESFGRVFVEAATRSKASIGVNQGGMTDIIRNGKTGFLVAPGDVKAISRHIANLSTNRPLSSEMGRSARMIAEKNFYSPSVAIAFENILKQVIRKDSTAPKKQ